MSYHTATWLSLSATTRHLATSGSGHSGLRSTHGQCLWLEGERPPGWNHTYPACSHHVRPACPSVRPDCSHAYHMRTTCVPIQASWVESVHAKWMGPVAVRLVAAERGMRRGWLTWRAWVFSTMMERLAHRMSGWRALSSHLELLPAAEAARHSLRRSGLQRGLRGWVAWRGRRARRRSAAQIAAPRPMPAARTGKGVSPGKDIVSRPTARTRKAPSGVGSPGEDIASRSKQWASRRDEALRRERAVKTARELEHCTFSPELNARSLRISAGRTAASGKPNAGRPPAGSPPIISSTRHARPTAPVTPPTPSSPANVATYARRERAGVGSAASQAQATEPAVATAADAAEQLVRHRLKVLAARVQQMRVLHSAANALSPPRSNGEVALG